MSLTVVFDIAVAAVYLGISAAIIRPTLSGGRWRVDQLALATAGTFVVLAIAHTTLRDPGVLPPLAIDLVRLQEGTGWQRVTLDLTAIMLALFHMRRERELRVVLAGEQLARHNRAFHLNDSVVQDLTVAQMALDLGASEKAEEAIQSAISSARQLVTGMLTDDRGEEASTEAAGFPLAAS